VSAARKIVAPEVATVPATARGMRGALPDRMTGRVLVADDDPDLLDLVATSLAARGLDVARAMTGADVLELLADSGPFDLMITDIAMPWMTGLQVVSSVRDAGLDIPVIVMTGLHDPNLSERVRAMGSRTSLLRKPFDLAQLNAAVAAILA
jgi:CheY-like chemotaxis protein